MENPTAGREAGCFVKTNHRGMKSTVRVTEKHASPRGGFRAQALQGHMMATESVSKQTKGWVIQSCGLVLLQHREALLTFLVKGAGAVLTEF